MTTLAQLKAGLVQFQAKATRLPLANIEAESCVCDFLRRCAKSRRFWADIGLHKPIFPKVEISSFYVVF